MDAPKRSRRARGAGDGLAIDEHQRRQQVRSRLDALQNDNDDDVLGGMRSDDEDFDVREELKEVQDEEVEVSVVKKKPKKKKRAKKGALLVGGKRKTRGMENKGPKPFLQLLEEAQLDTLPSHVPSYLTVAAGPSRYPPRKICDISGFFAKYKDPASKMRFAGLREITVIRETPAAALNRLLA